MSKCHKCGGKPSHLPDSPECALTLALKVCATEWSRALAREVKMREALRFVQKHSTVTQTQILVRDALDQSDDTLENVLKDLVAALQYCSGDDLRAVTAEETIDAHSANQWKRDRARLVLSKHAEFLELWGVK